MASKPRFRQRNHISIPYYSRAMDGGIPNQQIAPHQDLGVVGVTGSYERNRSMSPAPKLATMILETEASGSKDREVPPFVKGLLSRWDVRSADDHSAQLSSPGCDRLTGRERDVLALISQGCSNKRVARTLAISPETVKSHVKRIFLKLAVGTRTEAVFRAVSLELL
jgi:DNA-binding CsgD family transcriptional regulator